MTIQCSSNAYRTEREKLYTCWSEQLRSGWLEELKIAMQEFESVRDEQRRIHADVDLNVLRGARLVGMTTAGVANKQDLVAAMAPKVLHLAPMPALGVHFTSPPAVATLAAFAFMRPVVRLGHTTGRHIYSTVTRLLTP